MLPNSHKLNEELKRLEPIETQCIFCNEGKVTNIDSCLYTPIYNVNDRTHIVIYSSVKFSKIVVGIPRCYDCRNKHQSIREKPKLYAWILSIGIIIFLGIQYGILELILGSFVVPFAGIFMYYLIKHFLENNMGIPTEVEASKKDVMIQELLLAGWTLQLPRA
jgi:hypothetical protein